MLLMRHPGVPCEEGDEALPLAMRLQTLLRIGLLQPPRSQHEIIAGILIVATEDYHMSNFTSC